jgi:hypothetical protein
MKKVLLIAIAICAAQLCFSQTDFRNGFIITNKNDTLVGLVNYREGSKAYLVCDFKRLAGDNPVTYAPDSIKGYGFQNDKVFQSIEISIKGQPPKVAFVEVIVKGVVSLYKYESTYFVEKDHGKLQQLLNETRMVEMEGIKVLRSTNQYISTLNVMLFDCATIRPRIQRVPLEEEGLTTLIESYNACKGDSSTAYKSKKPWITTSVGITGGVNISRMSFDEKSTFEYLAGTSSIFNSPMIGLSLDAFAPRISERLSFHLEMMYFAATYRHYRKTEKPYITERNYVAIELQELRIPFGFRYTFPEKWVTPYLQLGASATFHLRSSSNRLRELETGNFLQTFNSSEALPLRKGQFGMWAGCGITKSVNHRFNAFAEVRGEITNGITANVQRNDIAKIANLQIVIGIRTK